MRADLFPSHSALSLRKSLQGAMAGLVATAPMSIFMLVGWKLLPRYEKYHLPPRLITEEITERVGIEDRLNEKELVGLTIFSHFGYGALFGWLYAIFEQRVPLHASLKGALTGLGVWAGSYLGWLPILGVPLGLDAGYMIYRGATGHCVFYQMLGINRAEMDGHEGIRVERAVTVNRPKQELFQMWRDFENLPQFMEHLESVEVDRTDSGRSHWVVKGPLDRKVEWD